jgi:hypothetical protein
MSAPATFQRLREDIVKRARRIAKETGGVVGVGKISDAEAAVLKEIEQALDG